MNADKQRIAIAEACGWTVVSNTLCNVIPDKNGDPELEPVADLPDYLNDLNACHAFEEELTWSNQDGRGTCSIYREHLERIVHAKWKSRDTECAAECHEWHATAAQRCEAFLKTLGKWEDDK